MLKSSNSPKNGVLTLRDEADMINFVQSHKTTEAMLLYLVYGLPNVGFFVLNSFWCFKMGMGLLKAISGDKKQS